MKNKGMKVSNNWYV